jgi:hypothetical protein
LADSAAYVYGKKPIRGGRYYKVGSISVTGNELAETNEAEVVIRATLRVKGVLKEATTTIALNLDKDDTKKVLAGIIWAAERSPSMQLNAPSPTGTSGSQGPTGEGPEKKLDMTCFGCKGSDFHVALRDYRKLSTTQPIKLPHQLPPDADAPTVLVLTCKACGRSTLRFPINEEYAYLE